MKWNILVKLATYTLGVVFLVGGSVTFYSLSARVSDIEQEFQTKGQSFSNLLCRTLTDPFYNRDVEVLQTTLREAIQDPDILHIFALDAKGTVLMSSQEEDRRFEKLPYFNSMIEQVKSSPQAVIVRQERLLHLGQAVRTPDGEIIGFLYFQLSLHRSATLIRQTTHTYLGLALALFLIGVIISIVLARSFVTPIRSLAVHTREIGQGNLDSTIKWSRPDELGDLADSINQMAENLKMTTINRNQLEDKIQERTEQLQAALEKAEESNRAKSEFLASMSHELRTPLNSMIGYTALVVSKASDQLDKENLERLNNANRSARNLLGLINDLLDFSQIEARRLEVHCDEFELIDLIEDLEIICEGYLENTEYASSVKLEFRAEDDSQIIYSDYVRLKQIFSNLLSNAIKFTRQGTISLQLKNHPQKKGVLAVVKDTGCGVEPKKLSTIFESFRQVDGSIKKKYGGTGLGLAITKSLCEMLEIDIQVESVIDEGTTFTLTIPLKISSVPEPITPPLEVSSPAPEKKIRSISPGSSANEIIENQLNKIFLENLQPARVLCLGCEATLSLLQPKLEGIPLELKLVETIEECQKIAANGAPVWAILLKPEAKGFEDLARLKEIEELRDIPVIMCTDQYHQRGMHTVKVEHLPTPVASHKLMETLIRLTPNSPGDLLIVEDDKATCELYRQVLEESGYRCHIFHNGTDALEYLKKSPTIQAILLDLLLPDLDGFQILKQLRENSQWNKIPVAIITGKDLTSEERSTLEKGSQLLLQKGKDSNNLSSHIRALIQSVELAGNCQILIIDDNEMNLHLMQGLLEEGGFSTLTALSAPEGLEIAQKEKPSLVLMDLAMPEMDGFEGSRRLRELAKDWDPVIIACSAFAFTKYAQEALKSGCEGFITKPVDPEKLVLQVKKFMLTARIRRHQS